MVRKFSILINPGASLSIPWMDAVLLENLEGTITFLSLKRYISVRVNCLQVNHQVKMAFLKRFIDIVIQQSPISY